MTIMQLGLPLANNPALNGNLFVQFNITFPTSLDDSQVDLCRQALIGQKPEDVVKMGDEEEHEMVPFDKTHVNKNSKKKRGEAYDEDDDDDYMGGGQGRQVRCANQ